MKSFLTLCLVSAVLTLQAQKTYLNNRYLMERINSAPDMLTGTTGMITGLPAAPGVVGDGFLNNNFSETNLLLFEGERIVAGYRAKYDILKDDFYLMHKNSIRVLSGGSVRYFSMIDSLTGAKSFYINGKLLKDNKGAELSGFYEVIVDGPSALLRKTTAIVKEADFHPALNVGSKDHRVIKTNTYFYCIDNVAQKMPAAKNISLAFPDQADAMSTFIKSNGLSLKDQADLKRLFEHYNSIRKE